MRAKGVVMHLFDMTMRNCSTSAIGSVLDLILGDIAQVNSTRNTHGDRSNHFEQVLSVLEFLAVELEAESSRRDRELFDLEHALSDTGGAR